MILVHTDQRQIPSTIENFCIEKTLAAGVNVNAYKREMTCWVVLSSCWLVQALPVHRHTYTQQADLSAQPVQLHLS